MRGKTKRASKLYHFCIQRGLGHMALMDGNPMGHSTRLLLETPEEPQSQTASNLPKSAQAIQGNAWGGASNTKPKSTTSTHWLWDTTSQSCPCSPLRALILALTLTAKQLNSLVLKQYHFSRRCFMVPNPYSDSQTEAQGHNFRGSAVLLLLFLW